MTSSRTLIFYNDSFGYKLQVRILRGDEKFPASGYFPPRLKILCISNCTLTSLSAIRLNSYYFNSNKFTLLFDSVKIYFLIFSIF